MLRGSASATVDDRGRLKVPTDFRRLLEERWGSEVFVTSPNGEAVRIYPLPVWEELESRLLRMPSTDRARNRYLERVNYYGAQTRLDPQGRVLVPALLRERAAMNGEVVVAGRLDYLEVWNHERFAARLEAEPLTDDDLQALSDRGF